MTAMSDSPSFLNAILVAQNSFPRGPGFYFHPAKLVFLVVLYLIWVRTCWWVDRDARQLRLSPETWSPILLGTGLLGLIVIWVMPVFWLSFFVMLLFLAGVTIAYVSKRNELVAPEEQVLTLDHLRRLARDGFRSSRSTAESSSSEAAGAKSSKKKKQKGAEDEDAEQIHFVGKSGGDRGGDNRRVARAAGSKEYQAALQMIYDALEERATDVHLEPNRDQMSVRLRIDGILQPGTPFDRHQGEAIINIFKVLADLDITEKRKPQDGAFSAIVDGDRNVDIRCATAGSVAGEKMVMRLLDSSGQIVNLPGLGMRGPMCDKVHGIVTQPHGLFVVCGPTGSGKSTTLYACLNEIDRAQKNVITVENPVEYHVEGVTQIEVNPKAGKTFAAELRSILRQDPDVIYIGEVRDQETAEIACQAAQTGHMVFTTIHANDTVTAIARLLDLGVAPYLVGSAVSAILGQRLARVLCTECKVRYKPNPDLLRKANLPSDVKFFYRPTEVPREDVEDGVVEPCEQCRGMGYYGRTGVFELLEITDRLRDMIREKPNLNAIKQEAIKNGMKTLQEDGLRQVINGDTSIQELLRVAK